MKIRLIHGIHSPEGDNNMSAFRPHIEKALPGAQVSLFQYGFMGFWAARFKNDGVAKEFAHLSRSGEPDKEVWITHSNGAAIAYLAVERYGAKPDMIINVNPALDRWRTASVKWVETIHSDKDRAVYVSQWLPGHIWGDQGLVGYKGRMQNTINHNATSFPEHMAYKAHNGLFDGEKMTHWADFMAHRIRAFT